MEGEAMLGRKRASRGIGRKFLLFGSAVAGVTYFFDRRLGRARRAKLRDQVGAILRRGARETSRKAEYTRGQVEGLRHAASQDSPPENDAVLTAKIESEVLSRSNYPKGQISVNSADGVVELRGVCESPEQINELEQEVRKITGVIDVHNFLHLPNTPAPNKQAARRAKK
jgi:osmotically-inducible protein OsmY